MFLGKRAAAVADGVGGWVRVGVDPGIYSKSLVTGCEKYSHAQPSQVLSQPVQILRKAYDDSKEITGSSTLCLATLHETRGGKDALTVCNVGDSGALIYRPSTGEVLFRSVEQIHDFNFPKQLGTNSDDFPEHADVAVVEVLRGDLIILCTDGIWDNMFDEDVVSILGNQKMSVEERNAEVVKSAFHNSLDPNFVSPFSVREKEWVQRMQTRVKRQRSVLRPYVGGKSDDITSVLAMVVSSSDCLLESCSSTQSSSSGPPS